MSDDAAAEWKGSRRRARRDFYLGIAEPLVIDGQEG